MSQTIFNDEDEMQLYYTCMLYICIYIMEKYIKNSIETLSLQMFTPAKTK